MSNLVVKDNALINASYNLSLVEQRLLLLAILELRKEGRDPLKNEIWIHADSYIEHFGTHRNTAYQALKDASKDLLARQFSYQEEINGKNINKTSRWVSSIGYATNDSFVSLEFAAAVSPLISELEKRFTSYEVEQVAQLTSAYAVRLYEILICWRSVGKTPQILLEDLRLKLGILVNEYERMERFKTRVLDLSIEQINKHTDITASYEQHKKGRTITGFTFKFKMKKDKKKVAAEATKRDVDNGDMFTVEGLSDKQLGRIARNKQFMADYNHLVSSTSPAGQTEQGWEFEMVNRLKRDSSQFNKRPIREYLDC